MDQIGVSRYGDWQLNPSWACDVQIGPPYPAAVRYGGIDSTFLWDVVMIDFSISNMWHTYWSTIPITERTCWCCQLWFPMRMQNTFGILDLQMWERHLIESSRAVLIVVTIILITLRWRNRTVQRLRVNNWLHLLCVSISAWFKCNFRWHNKTLKMKIGKNGSGRFKHVSETVWSWQRYGIKLAWF